jgi:hypothetical protein
MTRRTGQKRDADAAWALRGAKVYFLFFGLNLGRGRTAFGRNENKNKA